MKKQIIIFLMAMAVALPAAAGGGARCDGSTEELTAMQTKLADKAWLGIEYDKTDTGYFVITSVTDGSPADQAGFRKDDVLLTMQGEEYSKANKAALKQVWAKVEPGSEVEYVVKRDGAKVNLDATLAHVPVNLQEKWIAEHTAEYHADQQLVSTD